MARMIRCSILPCSPFLILLLTNGPVQSQINTTNSPSSSSNSGSGADYGSDGDSRLSFGQNGVDGGGHYHLSHLSSRNACYLVFLVLFLLLLFLGVCGYWRRRQWKLALTSSHSALSLSPQQQHPL